MICYSSSKSVKVGKYFKIMHPQGSLSDRCTVIFAIIFPAKPRMFTLNDTHEESPAQKDNSPGNILARLAFFGEN
jgi:hypothetical protein